MYAGMRGMVLKGAMEEVLATVMQVMGLSEVEEAMDLAMLPVVAVGVGMTGGMTIGAMVVGMHTAAGAQHQHGTVHTPALALRETMPGQHPERRALTKDQWQACPHDSIQMSASEVIQQHSCNPGATTTATWFRPVCQTIAQSAHRSDQNVGANDAHQAAGHMGC